MRGEKYVGVAGLAVEAAKILSESGLAQERGTVTEVPDERTVRYYLTEGLVSPAEEKQGTASVFGYRHLLQLLVVKKLQAEHLPIRKIRDLVDGRTERELERLLGAEGGAASKKNEALNYLEQLLTKPAPPQRAQPPPARSVSPPTAPAPQSLSTSAGGAGGTWSRVELEPGLELHVHDQYRPPRETRGLRRLTQLILRVIESQGRKPGK
ncbi:MAG TPA: MerR family transcriptional regulator [Pyrinomonadaceae bacterium]|nr:MerR family transcriptional regulator [Pyrinomonadaceae bacterium]